MRTINGRLFVRTYKIYDETAVGAATRGMVEKGHAVGWLVYSNDG